MESPPRHKLILIVLAQFLATSVWFAGNAIYQTLQMEMGFHWEITPQLTIAVQLGFISGTFMYAVFMIADRFSTAKVFLVSAILAALSSVAIAFSPPFWGIYLSRLFTGFFLAGIYPVGMKIASDWFPQKLGRALGYLVGALVLGTSFPHFLRSYVGDLNWRLVVVTTSILAVVAGAVVALWVGDGPHRKKSPKFSFAVFFGMFNNRMFNRASLGYFGHMWELYAFWAFVPSMIIYYSSSQELDANVSVLSFATVAVGSLGCIAGGLYAQRMGSCRIAFLALSMSALCGLLSLFWLNFPLPVFLAVLMIWGFFVVMDSPQFSSVIADYCDRRYLGSALTIVNGIGFAITIVSIEVLHRLEWLGPERFWILAIGPILGLYPTGKIAFRRNFPEL